MAKENLSYVIKRIISFFCTLFTHDDAVHISAGKSRQHFLTHSTSEIVVVVVVVVFQTNVGGGGRFNTNYSLHVPKMFVYSSIIKAGPTKCSIMGFATLSFLQRTFHLHNFWIEC